jgi:hypothetical protein
MFVLLFGDVPLLQLYFAYPWFLVSEVICKQTSTLAGHRSRSHSFFSCFTNRFVDARRVCRVPQAMLPTATSRSANVTYLNDNRSI